MRAPLPEAGREGGIAAGARYHPHAIVDASISPPFWLRGGHAQSILPSLPWRRPAVERRARPMVAASVERLIDCGDGTILQAFCARPARAAPRAPLTIVLHGWEGSAQSLYVLSLAQTLFECGHEVVRLNLRDHGETHHLNRELFHSCRLSEVLGALRTIQQGATGRPLYLAGFSLGGNFLLRAAAAARHAGIEVARVVAISPVLDPKHTLHALEHGAPLYSRYFVQKWSRSLVKKQAAWPGDYDFTALMRRGGLRHMTAELVSTHTSFPTLDDYFEGYAITGERLAQLEAPSTIIAALDDPIISPSDLPRLAAPAALSIVLTPHGGHCGFFEQLTAPSWADRRVAALLGT
ncbi:MAG TPA: alpha/beta fold hydrolase [Steroidobacteraceae bacterium]|nr:alpha/beta fold hydrolase [Steroidobacteraceae bacterium]